MEFASTPSNSSAGADLESNTAELLSGPELSADEAPIPEIASIASEPRHATISLGGSPCCSVIPRLPPKLRPLERPDSPQPLPCLTKSLNIPAPGKSGRRWENIGRFKLAESLTAGGFY